MASLRGKLMSAFGKTFGQNDRAYAIGKKAYQAGLRVKGDRPRKNKKSIDGPVAVVRVNADFSEEGAEVLLRLIKKYRINPVLAIKMEDADKNEEWAKLAKRLEKAGCELSVHGYHHSMRLPMLSAKEQEREISLALSAFKKHFGKSPPGFFASRNAYDAVSLRILENKGFKYYAELNNLYPERHGRLWDISLNRRLFDPSDSPYVSLLDHIIRQKGMVSVCWHMKEMTLENMGLYAGFLDYLKSNKVPSVNLSTLGRRLR